MKATEQKMSMKQICEYIHKADFLRDKEAKNPLPEEIFNYSPTGELFMIFEWYEIAKDLNESRRSQKNSR